MVKAELEAILLVVEDGARLRLASGQLDGVVLRVDEYILLSEVLSGSRPNANLNAIAAHFDGAQQYLLMMLVDIQLELKRFLFFTNNTFTTT
jgi:hypothetical protein